MAASTRSFGLADAARITERCFVPDQRPCDQVGLELEWLTIDRRRPDDRVEPDDLRPALPESLPAGGSISFEPGGQIELNTAPYDHLATLLDAARADADAIRRSLAAEGVELIAQGLDPVRPPSRVLRTARYEAMEATFAADGRSGLLMMCNSAALQLNVDLDAAGARWRLADRLGPVLAATFANSPFVDGAPSGLKASRLANWWRIDPSRTAPVATDRDPCRAWLEYALDARVLLVRADDNHYVAQPVPRSFREWMDHGDELGWPTADDFAYHLTTLFPPIRPRGWLELRMIDAVDDDLWAVATALTTALLCDAEASQVAAEACEPVAGRWEDAARRGLSDADFAEAALVCTVAARDALGRDPATKALADDVDEFLAEYVARGRCPADDLLDRWARTGALLAPSPELVS